MDFALPLSGPQARLGEAMRFAAEFAVRDARTRNNGSRDVVARFHDDRCGQEGGVDVARAMQSVRPAATVAIGFPCSAALAGALQVLAEKDNIVVVATGSAALRSGADAGGKALVFRMSSEWSPAAALADHLVQMSDGARVALIRDKTQYATNIMQQLTAALTRVQRPAVAVEVISGGDKDFATLADRLAALAVTHVAIAAYPGEAGLLVSDLVQRMPGVRIIGSDSLAVADFIKSIGSATGNVELLLQLRPEDFPGAAPLRQALSDTGLTVARPVIATHAAVTVWRDAIEMSGSTDAAAMASGLKSRIFQTILGPLEFDASRTARLPVLGPHVWRDGLLKLKRDRNTSDVIDRRDESGRHSPRPPSSRAPTEAHRP